MNADDLPDIVADENYAEYDLQGDALMQWGGEAPVAQVHHNSSLVLEECLIEGNIVRHEGGAAIAITAEADSDYDASDFPCSIAVRGSVVHSSFSPSNESSRVRLVWRRCYHRSLHIQQVMIRVWPYFRTAGDFFPQCSTSYALFRS